MSSVITDPKKIDTVLDRGIIANVLPSKESFREKLLSGTQLSFYIGVDPTAPSMHIGHGQNILLLEEFRQLGHAVYLVVGDFTARIGDPSEQETARNTLGKEKIQENVTSMLSQLDSVLGVSAKKNPAQIVYNSSWLDKLTFGDVTELATNFTVQQFLERDMFERRIEKEEPIYLNEFLYPLMQGYDSVALEIDAELGGTDQTFNMLAGRTLLKRLKDKEKFVITLNLLQNPKTGEMMSMSKGTGVMLNSSAIDMFGALMAQPDEMIRALLISNTRLPLGEVDELSRASENGGTEARDAKLRTAQEVVALYHSPDKAAAARKEFLSRFSKNEFSKNVETYTHHKKKDTLLNILDDAGLVSSRSEGRRLIEDGAVEIDGETLTNDAEKIDLSADREVRVGKSRFVRVVSRT